MPGPATPVLEFTRYRKADGQTYSFWQTGPPNVNPGDSVRVDGEAAARTVLSVAVEKYPLEIEYELNNVMIIKYSVQLDS